MPLILGTNSIKDTGYDVANSLRFNSGSSDYLNKTFGTPTSTKKGTHSFWFKLADDFTSVQFSGVWNNYYAYDISIDSSNRLNIYSTDTSTNTGISLDSTQVLRDPSAWYHVVVAIDTTQATASNRAKVYLNGLQITDFDTETYPNLNADLVICLGANNGSTSVGRSNYGGGANYYSGYMTEFIYVDGSQLDPTSFGEFDSDSPNIWKPKDVSGLTFGTNGFYLDFENASSLGADVSGNSNNFTVNNLTSVDQSTDTCTNNFATLNPLRSFEFTFSEGNLVATSDQPSDNRSMALSSFAPESGKWYAEVKVSTVGAMMIGLYATDGSQIDGTDRIYSSTGGIAYFATNGQKYVDGSSSSYGASYTTNDIIGIALNMDDEEVTFYKNNTSQGAISLTSGKIYNMGISAASTSACVASFNFGNPPFSISSGNADANGYGNFKYSVPSGYYALNTKNLAEFG